MKIHETSVTKPVLGKRSVFPGAESNVKMTQASNSNAGLVLDIDPALDKDSVFSGIKRKMKIQKAKQNIPKMGADNSAFVPQKQKNLNRIENHTPFNNTIDSFFKDFFKMLDDKPQDGMKTTYLEYTSPEISRPVNDVPRELVRKRTPTQESGRKRKTKISQNRESRNKPDGISQNGERRNKHSSDQAQSESSNLFKHSDRGTVRYNIPVYGIPNGIHSNVNYKHNLRSPRKPITTPMPSFVQNSKYKLDTDPNPGHETQKVDLLSQHMLDKDFVSFLASTMTDKVARDNGLQTHPEQTDDDMEEEHRDVLVRHYLQQLVELLQDKIPGMPVSIEVIPDSQKVMSDTVKVIPDKLKHTNIHNTGLTEYYAHQDMSALQPIGHSSKTERGTFQPEVMFTDYIRGTSEVMNQPSRKRLNKASRYHKKLRAENYDEMFSPEKKITNIFIVEEQKPVRKLHRKKVGHSYNNNRADKRRDREQGYLYGESGIRERSDHEKVRYSHRDDADRGRDEYRYNEEKNQDPERVRYIHTVGERNKHYRTLKESDDTDYSDYDYEYQARLETPRRAAKINKYDDNEPVVATPPYSPHKTGIVHGFHSDEYSTIASHRDLSLEPHAPDYDAVDGHNSHTADYDVNDRDSHSTSSEANGKHYQLADHKKGAARRRLTNHDKIHERGHDRYISNQRDARQYYLRQSKIGRKSQIPMPKYIRRQDWRTSSGAELTGDYLIHDSDEYYISDEDRNADKQKRSRTTGQRKHPHASIGNHELVDDNTYLKSKLYSHEDDSDINTPRGSRGKSKLYHPSYYPGEIMQNKGDEKVHYFNPGEDSPLGNKENRRFSKAGYSPGRGLIGGGLAKDKISQDWTHVSVDTHSSTDDNILAESYEIPDVNRGDVQYPYHENKSLSIAKLNYTNAPRLQLRGTNHRGEQLYDEMQSLERSSQEKHKRTNIGLKRPYNDAHTLPTEESSVYDPDTDRYGKHHRSTVNLTNLQLSNDSLQTPRYIFAERISNIPDLNRIKFRYMKEEPQDSPYLPYTDEDDEISLNNQYNFHHEPYISEEMPEVDTSDLNYAYGPSARKPVLLVMPEVEKQDPFDLPSVPRLDDYQQYTNNDIILKDTVSAKAPSRQRVYEARSSRVVDTSRAPLQQVVYEAQPSPVGDTSRVPLRQEVYEARLSRVGDKFRAPIQQDVYEARPSHAGETELLPVDEYDLPHDMLTTLQSHTELSASSLYGSHSKGSDNKHQPQITHSKDISQFAKSSLYDYLPPRTAKPDTLTDNTSDHRPHSVFNVVSADDLEAEYYDDEVYDYDLWDHTCSSSQWYCTQYWAFRRQARL